MNGPAWAMLGLSTLFFLAAAVLFFGYLALTMDDRRAHRGGTKPTSEYRRPPQGPAPGALVCPTCGKSGTWLAIPPCENPFHQETWAALAKEGRL